ncbi:MAG: hypothetical protein AAF610_05200 [Pseudomonadota bacterium]
MRADLEDLLSVTDGTAGDAERERVLSCPESSAELARLAQMRARLRALPEQSAPQPADGLFDAPAADTGGAVRWAAIAASALVAVVLGVVAAYLPDPPQAEQQVAEVIETGDDATEDVAELMRRSAQLEQIWRVLDNQSGAVQRLAAAGRAERIKARVRRLDGRYAALEPQDYWSRRVELMNTLVTVTEADRLTRMSEVSAVRRVRLNGGPGGTGRDIRIN